MFKYLGVALIVFALGIGIAPQFTDCYSQGQLSTLASGATQPMKCHWSAESEIAIAIPLAAVGIMMASSKRKGTKRSLSVMGITLGVLAIALPNLLIGTCAVPTHICNTVMKPSLNALGSLAALTSLGALMLTRNSLD